MPDLYGEPYDLKRPVVCFDETSKQLVAEKRSPIPAKAGRRERFDYEYERNGTRNLFMFSRVPRASGRGGCKVWRESTQKSVGRSCAKAVNVMSAICRQSGAGSSWATEGSRLVVKLKRGAEGQSRTDTGLPPPVFETGASTIPPLRPGLIL